MTEIERVEHAAEVVALERSSTASTTGYIIAAVVRLRKKSIFAGNATRRRGAQDVADQLGPIGDAGVSLEHKLAMTRRFAEWYRVQHGVPVQIDIHAGTHDRVTADMHPDSDAFEPAALRQNPHAHLLIPTRVLGPEGFGKKTRHLNPPFYRGRVMEEEYLRQIWAGIQQRYGEEHSLDIRIDPTGFLAEPHLGPLSCRAGKPDLAARLALVRQANAEAACDPVQVLRKLTGNNASFTERDLEWLLKTGLPGSGK